MKRIIDRMPLRAKQCAENLNLSPEKLEILLEAAEKTWNTIAYDILGGDIRKTMYRRQVIEIVMDADHIRTNNNLPDDILMVLRYNPVWVRRSLEIVFNSPKYGI